MMSKSIEFNKDGSLKLPTSPGDEAFEIKAKGIMDYFRITIEKITKRTMSFEDIKAFLIQADARPLVNKLDVEALELRKNIKACLKIMFVHDYTNNKSKIWS